MKDIHLLCVVLIGLTGLLAQRGVASDRDGAPGHWSLASPDGKIVVSIQLAEASLRSGPQLSYAVRRAKIKVIERSPLGVTMEGGEGNFTGNLKFSKAQKAVIDETYTLPSGKKRLYVNHANELTLTLLNESNREMSVCFRAYNDGIAYRYHFPGAGEQRVILTEASAFVIPLGSKAWGQPWVSSQNHESLYMSGVVGKDFFTGPNFDPARIEAKTRPSYVVGKNYSTSGEIWFPLLCELPGKDAWVLLTEAAVYGDYCCSRLQYTSGGSFCVRHDHARASDPEDKLTSTLPWTTPWRVAVIGSTLAPIVETVICENLNPPSEISDMSWIKPGRTSWTWWYDSKDDGAMGAAADRQLFEAFADEMGWEYGCGRGQTYADWGGSYNANTPISNRRHLLQIGPTLAEALGKQLAEQSANGKVILKCDFMDSDSQERMQDYDLISRLCMKYHIMVNFHGARLPGGERRRWPNVVGYEGVFGAEQYKACDGPTLFHRLCLPFTRNVVGPMDFTGVTFTGSATNKRKNSDAAELAIAMLYENGISYWGDHPDAYRARPAAMSFLKQCPSAWEDTKFVAGYPGEFVCLARQALQSGTWFLGAMANLPAHDVSIPLKFLAADQQYRLTLYHDSPDGKTIQTDTQNVIAATVLKIHLAANGGFAGVIE